MTVLRGCRLLHLALAAMLLWPAPLLAQNQADTHKKLQQLKSRIAELQEQLSGKRGQRSREFEALKSAEKRIGSLQKDIRDAQQALDRQQRQLEELQVRRRQLQAQQSAQKQLLERQVLAAYQLGREKKIKVLLNQESPDKVSRTLTYYDYFNRARAEHLETYLNTLRELDAVEPAIAVKTQELQQTRDQLTAQFEALKGEQAERKRSIARLDQDIGSGGRELGALNQEQSELQQVLEALQQEVSNLVLPSSYQPFRSMRGKMPWPASGKHINQYGSVRSGASLLWQGIQIAANEGTEVKAIHHGRVVFADWLRGAGLLIIVDHGDGYMSLYGHNQTLLRETGDWVNSGEVIGTVGNSGGQQRAGLYFEIRHEGKPTDPRRWCRS